ncbi:hypothetical protein SOVF_136630, partial [Spinacia oleracea]
GKKPRTQRKKPPYLPPPFSLTLTLTLTRLPPSLQFRLLPPLPTLLPRRRRRSTLFPLQFFLWDTLVLVSCFLDVVYLLFLVLVQGCRRQWWLVIRHLHPLASKITSFIILIDGDGEMVETRENTNFDWISEECGEG